MADAPPNRTRIVPIMARRKTSAKNPPSEAHTIPVQRQLRTRAAKEKAAEHELLRLSCLDTLGLYALPTKGDGTSLVKTPYRIKRWNQLHQFYQSTQLVQSAQSDSSGALGNCLYYALSDQMYGVWDRFAEIRMRLAGHMRAHRDYFINFTAAVGGERRAPRRAAAAASRSSVGFVGPAAKPEDQQQKFEAKVADSEKNRVWGGSEEIQAFCQSYKRDVRVYTNSGIQTFRDVYAPHQEERDVVHIAFHVSVSQLS
jgi:OTU-like cysteine protease